MMFVVNPFKKGLTKSPYAMEQTVFMRFPVAGKWIKREN